MESKRKSGASLTAPLAGRRMHTSVDWASLPIDMVRLVTDRLLHSGDIVDYVAFRAVCSAWRASTPTPRERDPALRDPRLRPRDWIALCGGDSVPPDDTGEIELFHTRTARRVCVRVPDLRDHRIVGFSQGLLVLVHKATAEIRVLHPFTCVAVDFPSLAPVYSEAIKYTNSFLQMNAAVCSAASSSSSIAVVLCVPYMHYVLAAEAGSDHWDILHRKLDVSNTLVFQGRLYGTTIMASRWEIVQLYPTTRSPQTLDLPVTVARAPSIPVPHHIFLVESRGQMLLVARAHHYFAFTVENISAYRPTEWWKDKRFTMYEVNLNNNGDAKLSPVSCLLDRALFLSDYGCLSVSAIDLPSLVGNSIYFSVSRYPVLMHSLTTGLSEELAVECQIHDGDVRIRPSVRPFTIIDHLLTFCHPNEWTKGLMFHEYHEIPTSFKELLEKISAKWWEYKFRPSQAVHMGRETS
ncbi:hypothetical protein QYE76_062016 [Lolium multiflorum]|uniref:KIB1-4 beta-propeller domain-containing protein n=1 Tax=Lolium multiflorum TaxID=4521 RepID=A0AAD8S1W4_LOLMU|nr:hypothetical protein QYE76_062016 [Lolium multiflorum]